MRSASTGSGLDSESQNQLCLHGLSALKLPLKSVSSAIPQTCDLSFERQNRPASLNSVEKVPCWHDMDFCESIEPTVFYNGYFSQKWRQELHWMEAPVLQTWPSVVCDATGIAFRV